MISRAEARSWSLRTLSEVSPAGVFTLADARAAGIAPGVLRGLLESGACLRIGHGIYQVASASTPDDHLSRVRARLSALEGPPVVAHVTAAQLHRLRTPFESQATDDRVWILRDPSDSAAQQRHGLVVLPAQFERAHVTLQAGIHVTSIARTAMDLARGCPIERALVPLDHALSRGVPRGALVELAVFMKGWPGSAVFKDALAIANPSSESGLESIARGLVHREGLPEPELQVELRGESRRRYRVDMFWREQEVVLEVDGKDKYNNGRSPHFDEKVREDDLRLAGWRVVRWTYDTMFLGDRPAISWLKRELRRGRPRQAS